MNEKELSFNTVNGKYPTAAARSRKHGKHWYPKGHSDLQPFFHPKWEWKGRFRNSLKSCIADSAEEKGLPIYDFRTFLYFSTFPDFLSMKET